ncbi:hypothetical protein [Tumebacillus permanentifrigoris]|uniref:Uncharacterized protein n=1 Tax=Tumebacillus permanentifrigoris TaxID=378543 RepID=A0A316D4G3_9BACL|nr:hypothetical protein [Tumebacillus permanentifrigoris]PWK05322.1 hypothetical protein C7459_12474 [Tumebacillus permanentifrigoris]
MAQTAIQFAFAGMEQTNGYEEIKRSVVEMLKAYPKLNAKINSAKRRSEGKGLVIRPFQLDPEVFQALKTVGRAYTADSADLMHSEKAERVFQSLSEKSGIDSAVLDQIAGLLAGTTPFGGEGYSYGGKVFATREAAQERAQGDALQEVEDLTAQKGLIEEALNDLKSFAPHLEKLLRVRYIDGEKITAACTKLGIQPRTQDDWHREAVGEIAPLLGIGRGW